jgi:hypothetical protein
MYIYVYVYMYIYIYMYVYAKKKIEIKNVWNIRKKKFKYKNKHSVIMSEQREVEKTSKKFFLIMNELIDLDSELTSEETMFVQFGSIYNEWNKKEGGPDVDVDAPTPTPTTDVPAVAIDMKQIEMKIHDRMLKYSDSRLESETETNSIELCVMRRMIDLGSSLGSEELDRLDETLAMFMFILYRKSKDW